MDWKSMHGIWYASDEVQTWDELWLKLVAAAIFPDLPAALFAWWLW